MKKFILYTVLVVDLLFLSCRKTKSDQKIIEAGLQAFYEVEINNTFDVFLTQDTSFSIKIIGDEDFVNDVVYEVNNSVLSVSVNSGSRWLKPKKNKISVYINSDSLRLLTVNESSLIQTVNPIVTHEFGLIMKSKLNEAKLDLGGSVFYYWNIHPCGGKISLSGDIFYLKLWNVGLMEIDAGNLTTSLALVENKSKAPCRVNVKDRIEYSILGEGNIYLQGNPPQIIEKEITSTGKLLIVN